MFREADIKNILNFQKTIPKQIIMLEQNYRSTQNIFGRRPEYYFQQQNQFQKLSDRE